jgi:hypothetical protein
MPLRESRCLLPEVTLEFVDLPEELLFLQGDALLLYFQELHSLAVVALGLTILGLSSLELGGLELEGLVHGEELSQVTV